MNAPQLAPNSLLQIAICSQDVPKLAAFYKDVVGLKHLFDAGPNLSFFDIGGTRLMITQPSSAELDHPPSLLYYRVEDLESVHSVILDRGGIEEHPPAITAEMPDHELWSSFLRDCDNNLFALMCERPLKD
ncbi:VOC family protein [Pelagicoccus sp. SDUM812002]|uniref:VOC family protein n=1 Tax=Pelagicoccus sp. SDUM812002 TaxID=3041266 RepID=UPI00280D5FFE|nr:VOC family protein [Pelagicoccus sp. SDUM812002]MDQ8188036.1 VOC family protein [Pelagicoccus sp. SDUM812002]